MLCGNWMIPVEAGLVSYPKMVPKGPWPLGTKHFLTAPLSLDTAWAIASDAREGRSNASVCRYGPGISGPWRPLLSGGQALYVRFVLLEVQHAADRPAVD